VYLATSAVALGGAGVTKSSYVVASSLLITTTWTSSTIYIGNATRVMMLLNVTYYTTTFTVYLNAYDTNLQFNAPLAYVTPTGKGGYTVIADDVMTQYVTVSISNVNGTAVLGIVLWYG
jgi:hypothetical protein